MKKKQYNSYKHQKLRGLERKLYLLNLRGIKCSSCGYNKNIAALDFHHVNSEEKTHQLDLRTLSNSTLSWILTEFKKCVVLCSNCHREIHNESLSIENIEKLREELRDEINNSKVERTKKAKPKCIDCEKEISYYHKRCRPCNFLSRKK